MAIDLGTAFNTAVLEAAGVDPATAQLGTLTIDALPDTGDVTIRYTVVGTVDADTLRALICEHAGPADAEG